MCILGNFWGIFEWYWRYFAYFFASFSRSLCSSDDIDGDVTKMFWKLLLMKLFVDIILLAVLTQDGWSFSTEARKMLFIWQHGLR